MNPEHYDARACELLAARAKARTALTAAIIAERQASDDLANYFERLAYQEYRLGRGYAAAMAGDAR
jgi:hypothetical protein